MQRQISFFKRQLSKVRFHFCRAIGQKNIKQKFKWGELYLQFDWMGSNIYFENFEREEAELLQKLIEPKSVVMDIGANIGFYSVLLAKKAKNGFIFSFEPSTREYELLSKNVELNMLSNVRLFKKALASKSGKERLFINDSNHGANSFIVPQEQSNFEEVEVTTIDEIVTQSLPSRIDLIKIDVEGWELEVLKGAQDAIAEFRPLIFFESWKSFKKPFSLSISNEIEFLISKNYLIASYYNNRLNQLKLGDEIATKDLLAVPVENNIILLA